MTMPEIEIEIERGLVDVGGVKTTTPKFQGAVDQNYSGTGLEPGILWWEFRRSLAGLNLSEGAGRGSMQRSLCVRMMQASTELPSLRMLCFDLLASCP